MPTVLLRVTGVPDKAILTVTHAGYEPEDAAMPHGCRCCRMTLMLRAWRPSESHYCYCRGRSDSITSAGNENMLSVTGDGEGHRYHNPFTGPTTQLKRTR